MKKYIRYSVLIVLLIAVRLQAQNESKTFRESFPVNKDVEVEVNTSHTDVEFETWDRNTVEVEATIEVTGISREEAEKYFKSWKFEAVGNKDKVSVSTRPGNVRMYYGVNIDDMDFSFVLPDLPDLPEMPDILIPPIPPMPPKILNMPHFSFDYEAYKKEGDKYLKEWKKKWRDTFDESFKKEMESWKEEMESHREKVGENAKRIKIDREKIREQAREIREQAEKSRQAAMDAAKEAGSEPAVFLFYGNGKEKEVNVKKHIRIKMPKGAKLKMNVRHGEVKLAENSENIQAVLSHASLKANKVNGKETSIETSYAPVLVHNWNGGTLKVNYVREVDLENVGNLELISNSSDVTVKNLLQEGHIQGSFGKLKIERIGERFNRLDVILDNTNAVIVLPGSAFDVSLDGKHSGIKVPSRLKVSTTREGGNTLIRGYHRNSGSDNRITLQARYSDITFH